VAYLILSDIHANLEALEAVLKDAAGLYDRILCLGDLVGYGADPNAVVEWARANLQAVVRGNHDKACVGMDDLEGYNMAARKSAEWTRRVLTKESREYLERLPRGPVPYVGGTGESGEVHFDLVHGSPLDEDEYLITGSDVWAVTESLDTDLTFFGHTHVQGGFAVARNGIMRIVPEGVLETDSRQYWLVNPGSVGQPRDQDPRAAYALYSPEDRTVDYRRVSYDIDRAAEKIRKAGLPDSLAARLYEGV
jgi:predicted phosphodiesterase